MGNCFALCRPNRCSYAEAAMAKQQKIVKVVKKDGKILEFIVPILVNDLLVNFPGSSVALSKEDSQHLPSNYELKTGKVYYLLPSPSSGSVRPAGVSSMAEAEQGDKFKRIKVVITKQQLQELLSKRISVEEVLSVLKKTTCSRVVSSTNWKPELEAIPE